MCALRPSSRAKALRTSSRRCKTERAPAPNGSTISHSSQPTPHGCAQTFSTRNSNRTCLRRAVRDVAKPVAESALRSGCRRGPKSLLARAQTKTKRLRLQARFWSATSRGHGCHCVSIVSPCQSLHYVDSLWIHRLFAPLAFRASASDRCLRMPATTARRAPFRASNVSADLAAVTIWPGQIGPWHGHAAVTVACVRSTW